GSALHGSARPPVVGLRDLLRAWVGLRGSDPAGSVGAGIIRRGPRGGPGLGELGGLACASRDAELRLPANPRQRNPRVPARVDTRPWVLVRPQPSRPCPPLAGRP